MRDLADIDSTSPPFDQLTSVRRLAAERAGRDSFEYARHQLYVGRDKQSRAQVLVKLSSKPGIVYQSNLTNEIASLTTINRELPSSRYFPLVLGHGKLRDGRVYLVTSLFDELPLATALDPGWIPARTVAHLRTALEIGKAVIELHGLGIFHVDLNPMNILRRVEKDRPIIRIVDFESSYELARHSTGVSYNPPTTPAFSAPEVAERAPDARSDLFSLGAVLYTMLAGGQWTWEGDASVCIAADAQLDDELKAALLKAVAADPDRRYPTVQKFHTAIGAYLERIWPGRSW